MSKIHYHLFAVLAAIMIAAPAMAQQITVSGRVTDASDGTPLIGAGILVSGGSGTVTDFDGRYVVTVSADAEITFTSLGYVSVKENISGRTAIDAALVPETQSLDEIVVLGYTTQKKAELSSAVVSMSGEKLRDVSTSDVGNMLQGKVAGVVVMNSSGQPGSEADIRIRGTGSITAGAGPLYVVDGVAGGSFSPNDIETITVLKDASATALYGAAASGGVIVVTTKSGNQDKTTVNFRANGGIKKALTGRFNAMDSEELYEYFRSMYSKNLFKTRFPATLLERDFDWVNNSFKLGNVQDYFISASGKSGKVGYYASIDHYNEKGTLINTSYNKTSARLNLTIPIATNFTTNVRLNYARTNEQGTSSWRVLEYAYYAMPWDVPYVMEKDADGNWFETSEYYYHDGGSTRTDNGENWWTQNPSNILHSEQYNYSKGHGESITADLQFIWNVTDWLTITSTNRFDSSNSYYESYVDPRSYDGVGTGGELSNSDGEWNGWGTTNIAKLHKAFGAHDLTGIVGWEYGEGYSRSMGAVGTNFPAGQRALSNTVMKSIEGSDYHTRSWALLGQAQYSYLGKYIVTASVRYDESYKFGPYNRGGFFPGVSAAWIVSKEDFLSGSAFSFLKLRGGYGKTGNDNIPAFQYQDTFSLSTLYNNKTAAVLERQANFYLGWEEANMASLGVDATLFNNVNITLDLYNTINSDILLEAPKAPSSGFFAIFDNVGKIRNRGIELAVDGTIINKKDFAWSAGLNLGYNQNRVLELPEHKDMVLTKSDVSQILIEGHDVYTWYMPKWMGVDPETGKPQWERIDPETGESSIVNKFNQATPQVVGSASPWFSGGINTALRYKSFTLSANGSFVVGNKIYNKNREHMDSDGAYTSLNQMSIDNGLGWWRWEEPGDVATHPKAQAGRSDGSNKATSRYLEDGSFFRLRNVTLSYNLPASFLSKIKVSDAKVFLSGDNIFTLSKFSGMDPEVRLDSDTWSHAGLYAENYPVPLSVVLGIDIKF